MNEIISELRSILERLAPYPDRCVGFNERPTMNGTAFFPGGDGLRKANVGDNPEFPFGGTLVLGSDFGDVESYDRQFKRENSWRHELDGATWRELLKILSLAGINQSTVFCSNAWPCLREGNSSIEGGIPGAEDAAFTARCIQFFRATIEIMKPTLIIPLGIAPTRFVGRAAPQELAHWADVKTWKQLDRTPIGTAFGAKVVPLVHPSMPNRRHRVVAKTRDQESALVRSAGVQSEEDVSQLRLPKPIGLSFV